VSKLRTLAQIGRAFGMRAGALRLEYELQRGSGLMLRRMRSVAGWDHWTLANIAPGISSEDLLRARQNGRTPFFFSDARTLAPRLKPIVGEEREAPIQAAAKRILDGNLPYFGRLSFSCGFPPNWLQNPQTGEKVSANRSWTTMRFASPDYGDLKFILEPSRFLFVYPLVRAYALSGDERFAAGFWNAVEDWSQHNPPMSGPLWICGQESSLRILAWSFALFAFLNSPATSPQRVTLLTSMIAAHAWRAEQTLGYARSQRSNHLMSEAVGLWTAGVLFPELKFAAAWRELGGGLLREAVLDQITSEGVHLQYSFNYQRMVLQLLLWTLRLAQVHQIELPTEVSARTSAALEFVRAFTDSSSGTAPNYGANDGSLILPLSICECSDFRPLLQLGAAVLGQARLAPGPWDEAGVWFGTQPSSSISTSSTSEVASRTGAGFHRLGTRDSWAQVRSGRYDRRPFQADQLHVDLWHRGLNLACDAGTYLYNGDPPWDNALARTAVHNTVTIDDQDQMRRAGRFLWLDWAQATGRSFTSPHAAYADRFEGQHDGYRRIGITHHRALQFVSEDAWVVIDDIVGPGEHEIRLHWLVPDLPLESISYSPFHAVFAAKVGPIAWNILARTEGKASLIRAGKSLRPEVSLAHTEVLGWESPTYGELRPAVSIVYRTRAKLPVRFITVVLVGPALRLESDADHVTISRGTAELHHVSLRPQVKSELANEGLR
jgi:hypothetical protein